MSPSTSPEVGAPAPDFKLKGRGGSPVTLSEYRGRPVVLVFYPLAFSSVCSHQLPAIEKDLPRFEALNAVVLGISVDSHFSNSEFASKLHVSFPLLSDIKREASEAYGMFIPEAGYSGRAIFLIDPAGRLAYKDVSPEPGVVPSNAAVLSAIQALA